MHFVKVLTAISDLQENEGIEVTLAHEGFTYQVIRKNGYTLIDSLNGIMLETEDIAEIKQTIVDDIQDNNYILEGIKKLSPDEMLAAHYGWCDDDDDDDDNVESYEEMCRRLDACWKKLHERDKEDAEKAKELGVGPACVRCMYLNDTEACERRMQKGACGIWTKAGLKKQTDAGEDPSRYYASFVSQLKKEASV